MLDDMTLDPPGSIAVVGAGPLGIEAALYGRYLGYDVTLIEAVQIANSLHDRKAETLPVPPDRCCSPLASAALQSQYPDFAASTKPLTICQWIDDVLVPLTETDLLRGRLICPCRVVEIQTVQIELDEQDDIEEEIPPDFRLTVCGVDGTQSIDAESVILAVGEQADIVFRFELPAPYCFRIGQRPAANAEAAFWTGLREIVSLYASLVGREDLDLYRPRRH